MLLMVMPSIDLWRQRLWIGCVVLQLHKLVPALPVESQQVVVVWEKRWTVGDGEERDSKLPCIPIHHSLDIDAHGARALIQDCKLRPMVEETRHGHALLLPAR